MQERHQFLGRFPRQLGVLEQKFRAFLQCGRSSPLPIKSNVLDSDNDLDNDDKRSLHRRTSSAILSHFLREPDPGTSQTGGCSDCGRRDLRGHISSASSFQRAQLREERTFRAMMDGGSDQKGPLTFILQSCVRVSWNWNPEMLQRI